MWSSSAGEDLNGRPAFFMENLFMVAPAVAATGQLTAPTGRTRVAMAAVADVALSAATALTSAAPLRSAYDLTGPEAVTFDYLAAALSGAGHANTPPPSRPRHPPPPAEVC